MSWKDSFIPASFRGVPFKISSSSADFGRRSVQHEYPLKNIPYSEDLGRKKQEFSIEAFVIGDNYIRERDRLIRACEEISGRGRLEHPYYGTKFVVCTGCKVSETTEEGRMARLSLSFIEAGEKRFPAASTNFFSRLGVASDNLTSSALSHFSKTFNILGYPNFVAEQASIVIVQLGDSLNSVRNIGENTSDFSQNLQNLVNNFDSLASTPALLGQQIIDAISEIENISFDLDSSVKAYKSFFEFGSHNTNSIFSPTHGQISTSREQINKNRTAIIDLIIITAVARSSISAVEKSRQSQKPRKIVTRNFSALDPLQISSQKIYPAYENIIVERQTILDQIDILLESTLDDSVYQSLQSHKRALIQSFPDPDLDLPNLITITNIQTKPVLVIAYDLYEQVEIETDIIKRNHIEHPGFVAGGLTLEVISNG